MQLHIYPHPLIHKLLSYKLQPSSLDTPVDVNRCVSLWIFLQVFNPSAKPHYGFHKQPIHKTYIWVLQSHIDHNTYPQIQQQPHRHKYLCKYWECNFWQPHSNSLSIDQRICFHVWGILSTPIDVSCDVEHASWTELIFNLIYLWFLQLINRLLAINQFAVEKLVGKVFSIVKRQPYKQLKLRILIFLAT